MSQQINLFTPVLLKKQAYFSARTMVQAMGLVAIGMFAGYAALLYESRALQERTIQAAKDFDNAVVQFNSLGLGKGAGGPSQALLDEVTRLERQKKQQAELIESLAGTEIGNTEGFSKYLTAFARQRLTGVWLTGFSIGGTSDEIIISGKAQRPDLLPAYIRLLGKEEALQGRQFNELQAVAVEEAVAARPSAATAAPPARVAAEPAKNRFIQFKLGSVAGANPPGGR